MNGEPHPALAALRDRFPGVEIWRGHYTGHWWAIADGRLLEAVRPDDMATALTQLAVPQTQGTLHVR